MKDPTDIPVDPPPDDPLDASLRAWHQASADRAQTGRERFLRAMTEQDSEPQVQPDPADCVQDNVKPEAEAASAGSPRARLLRRIVMNRYSPLAASVVLAAALIGFLLPTSSETTYAGNVILAPEGGRLDALDAEGNVLGPCPLEHTDVNVSVSGHLTRVTLRQQYRNSYADKIEAVYTFPMSHRAAVDRMTMTTGDRVIVAEVHERARARAIYEAARERGHVASLLEQERPNIFTQSVANIEPDADVIIEISYVELLQAADGVYSFDFPMVVGPRYIPGSPTTSTPELAAGLEPRRGLVLLCPAKLTLGEPGEVSTLGTLQTGKLTALLRAAQPIAVPDEAWWHKANAAAEPNDDTEAPATQPAPDGPNVWYRFEAAYPDGSKDIGELLTDGTGHLDGRWFFTDPKIIEKMGTGFSSDTGQVPDASRITPEPVKPGTRAGHDIAIRVTVDTGGPGIVDLKSTLHEVVHEETVSRDDGRPRMVALKLESADEIPNRDFVLTWRQTADAINEATFTHTGNLGKFFTLIVRPPERIEDAAAVPRELVFVLDTSGSMRGFPIDKAKEVMAKAIDALRPGDTFNLITFAGSTHILWEKPRPNTPANRTEAQGFLATRKGRGGTEMMKAINAALVQTRPEAIKPLTPDELANLPADGREVVVRVDRNQTEDWPPPNVRSWWSGANLRLSDGSKLAANYMAVQAPRPPADSTELILSGRWTTRNRSRILDVTQLRRADEKDGGGPIRIVCFMTDGKVGNDMAIIDAVKENAHTTRVFSFGIGNSVNRYLLDSMARAGRGEVEYVLLEDAADEKVKRFAQRIQTPVLTDVELAFSDALKVTDLVPGRLPDLFDVKPLVLHGRYTEPGSGTLTIRGNTGAGRYERVLNLELPESQPEHDTIATLWARAKVEELMNQDLAAAQRGSFPTELWQEVVELGEAFSIMTQFTSFVAVEKARVTIGGRPRLVAVPIEMPQGVSYEGIFGCDPTAQADADGDGVDDVLATVLAGTRTERGEHVELEQVGRNIDGLPRSGFTLGMPAGQQRANINSAPDSVRLFTLVERESAAERAPSRFGRGGGGMGGGMGGMGGGMMGGRGGAGGVVVTGRPVRSERLAEQVLPQIRQSPMPARRGYADTRSHVRSTQERLDGRVRTSRSRLSSTRARRRHSTVAGVDRESRSGDGIVVVASENEFNIQGDKCVLTGDAAGFDELARLFEGVEPRTPMESAVRTLICGRGALRVVALVSENKLDDARKLAEVLVKFDGTFAVGVKLRDTLADDTLAAAERDQRMAALADEAKQTIAAAERQARLIHRLDARLYQLVTADDTAAVPSGVTMTDRGVLVTVLTTSPDTPPTDALEKAGLTIETIANSLNVVVGTVPRDMLATVALLDGVRKIDPTETE